MTWTGVDVLVTGAGGFIGSHLAERLVSLGARVRALVHYNALNSSGWLNDSAWQEGLHVIAGDINDRESLHIAMDGVDTVFHLAALIAIPYSYQAPASYLRVNVGGTLNVLQTAREVGVRRVIHTSTSEVYGTARYIPIDEGHPLQGQSPYAASKIGADKFAEAFYLSFGVPVVTIRPFNTFGPRQSSRAVIPTIVAQCLIGSIVKLGNVHPTRDFNYVSNTVDGFIRAASVPDIEGRTINLGSGHELSIRAVAEMTARCLGRPMSIEYDAQRARPTGSEVDQLRADNRLACDLLGWEPAVSFEDGLARTTEWIRSRAVTSAEAYVI